MSLQINIKRGGRSGGGSSSSGFSLQDYGYKKVDRLSKEKRRRSLVAAAVDEGRGVAPVLKILHYCATVNSTRNPSVAQIFEDDADWLVQNESRIADHIAAAQE